MKIVPVPCLRDNYAYLLIDEKSNEAIVVDPSEAGPVRAKVGELGVKLGAILSTHHHHDHVGGNNDLLRETPELPVYAHASDRGRVPGQTHFLDDGEVVALDLFSFKTIHNPGHTRGAVSYYFEAQQSVFTGDTLFTAGCGRLFEGTPGDLRASLERIGELPDDTRVYCGHEYTIANLAFARTVEPNSAAIEQRENSAEGERQAGRPTVPSMLRLEKETNPFLRVREPAVIESAEKHAGAVLPNADAVFGALRSWKDSF